MRWIGRLALLSLTATVVTWGSVATAGAARRSVPGSPAANVPSGYAIETTMITVSADTQTQGKAMCPTKDVVLGGGVLIVSDNLNADVNSSWPTNARTWAVNVNNGDSAPSNVTIYAVCAHKPTGYQQVKTATIANPAGEQTRQIADCPAGKDVLGGGGHSTSSSLAVAESSSLPGKTTTPTRFAWGVGENNESASAAKMFTVAICGKPSGYKLINGSFTTDVGDTLQQATVTCPSGTVPLGGGVDSGMATTGVNINTTEPSNTGWIAYEANSTSSDVLIRASVTCAS